MSIKKIFVKIVESLDNMLGKSVPKKMRSLTKEQKEYMQMKIMHATMMNTYVELIKHKKIPCCFPEDLKTRSNIDLHFVYEKYFYLFLEILQGKQREQKEHATLR